MFLVLFVLLYQFCVHNAEITGKNYTSIPPVFHVDSYDHCMLLEDEAFYCSFTFNLEPIDKENPSEYWKIIEEISANEQHYDHFRLRHGICVKESCPNALPVRDNATLLEDELNKCYNEKYKNKDLKGYISKLHCQTDEPLPVDTLDIVVAVLLIGYVVFVFTMSLIEGILRYQSEETYQKVISTRYGVYLTCFSITANWYKLKKVELNKDMESLRCINGIRTYNTMLVIASHTVMSFFLGPVANIQYPETMSLKPGNIFLTSGTYAIASYIMMSSFLLVYTICYNMEGKNAIPLKYLGLGFLGRLFRIMPTLVVMVAFHATWLRHLGNGPFWDEVIGHEVRNCRANWWTNLLFINNYVNAENMCIPQTWYLDIDTLFFSIILLVFYVVWRNRSLLWPILGGLLVLQTSVMAYLMYTKNVAANTFPTPEKLHYGLPLLDSYDYYLLLYSPWGNGAPLVSGIFWGYMFYLCRNKQVFTTKLQVVLWAIFSIFICLLIVIIPGAIIHSETYEHDSFFATVYICTARPLFAFTMGFFIFGVTQGHGWMAKWALEWPPTYYLGRISFGAYLSHVAVILIRPGYRRTPHYVSDYLIVFEFFGDMTISFLIGLILTLVVEMPFSKLFQVYVGFKKEDKIVVADKNIVKNGKID